jgi:hypothetical protein
MSEYEFSFIVEGFDVEDAVSNDLLVENFDYARASETAGLVTVLFNVEAAAANDALHQTLKRFSTLFPNAKVVRLNRDLVSIADVASRTNRTGESVRLYVTGKRGPGSFPMPISVLHGGTRVWEWATVVDWFRRHLGELTDEAEMIDAENAALFDAHLATQRPEIGQREAGELETSIAGLLQVHKGSYASRVTLFPLIDIDVMSTIAPLAHPIFPTAVGAESLHNALIQAWSMYGHVGEEAPRATRATGRPRKSVTR